MVGVGAAHPLPVGVNRRGLLGYPLSPLGSQRRSDLQRTRSKLRDEATLGDAMPEEGMQE